jgi:hypothetical protein
VKSLAEAYVHPAIAWPRLVLSSAGSTWWASSG